MAMSSGATRTSGASGPTDRSLIIGGINGLGQATMPREGETVYVKDRSDIGWTPVTRGAPMRIGHNDETHVGTLVNVFEELAEDGENRWW